MKKFWMVYGGYQSNPTKKHETELEARNEAERLAQKQPEQEFFLLEAVAVCQSGKIEWITLLEEKTLADKREDCWWCRDWEFMKSWLITSNKNRMARLIGLNAIDPECPICGRKLNEDHSSQKSL